RIFTKKFSICYSYCFNITEEEPERRILLVGRDIFGRQSLVMAKTDQSFFFGVRVDLSALLDWREIPFGHVIAFDFANDVQVIRHYADIEGQSLYQDSFREVKVIQSDRKREMLNITRESSSSDVDYATELLERTTEAVRIAFDSASEHIGVCFSGGVDSTFVAHAVHSAAPAHFRIDLINVAFGSSSEDFEKAPDRTRALLSFKSLEGKYPSREFRLILVNVGSEEMSQNRQEFIANAVLPATSVLDESLGVVLWFALRGRGVVYQTGEAVETPAKMMFLGSGADEVFAGYARHRTRFERDRSNIVVAEECEKELRRLGSRNGGRDARVAAQLGKIIVSPILDDKVVSWANQIPVNAKWDLAFPRGVGEKKIIRDALRKLGSPHEAPKQAMQFGSRMAKMSNENSNTKGSDSSPRLEALLQEQ
ncbi:unnamed protein product, partial [Caenorhabditis auriculariae]